MAYQQNVSSFKHLIIQNIYVKNELANKLLASCTSDEPDVPEWGKVQFYAP